MSSEPVLGVDFGTSNSAAGTLIDGLPHLFDMENEAQTLPTAFFFDVDLRETFVGSEATQALIDGRDGRFMRALKRVLGTPLMHEERHLLGERVTFVDVIARFLGHLKGRAEAQSGLVFKRALSGRPVHFHDHDPGRDAQAEADLRACYLAAGFEAVDFMLEPEAAAISYGAGRDGVSRGLIVDIGGGTSDFSVFEVDGLGAVNIISNHGVRVGGTDFDRALSIACVMPLLGKDTMLRKEMGADLTPTPNAIFNDLATWEKIPFLYTGKTRKMAADMAKLAVEPQKLGRLSDVLINELGHDLAFSVERGKIAANDQVDGSEIDLAVLESGLSAELSPERLEAALGPHLETIKATAIETVARAGLIGSQIDRVIYVGGSSLIGALSQVLHASFPDADHQVGDVFTAVADGLAIASGNISPG